MLVLLPVLALGLSVLVLKVWLQCWRTAILGGALIWGAVLVASTEGLSALQHLGAIEVATGWLAVLAVGIAVVAANRRSLRTAWSPQCVLRLARASPLFTSLLGALVVLVVVLGAVAVVSPPNTWDSMTYHMARVVQWTTNGSLAPYPTHILRQLYLQPGAEFVLLHLQLLSGGDHFAGLVQWAAMLGTLVGISLIARDLGASRLGQLLAAIVAASVPIGVLESTSTQNDYVVAFWLVCSVVFALRIVRSSTVRVPWAATAGFGISMGLALLTKATAYLYVLPFLIWVAASLLKTHGARATAPLALVAVLAVALNAGVYARNLAVFGSSTGPLDEGLPNDSYLNATLTPSLLASNVVRDLGLNLVATPFGPLNAASKAAIDTVHTWIQADSADPRTTWGAETFEARSPGLAFDENFAANPVHLVLLVAAIVVVPLMRRSLPPTCLPYALALATGFVLFCAVLRWQPWHTRLELPLFVLGAPLIATIVDRVAPRLAPALAIVLLVGMLPWVAYNQARPLVGPRSILTVDRDDQYFANQPGLRDAYRASVAFLANHACGQVGFVSTADGWEYPLWPLLAEVFPGPVTVQDVDVTNISSRSETAAARAAFQPCAVMSIDRGPNSQPVDVGSSTFRPAWTMGRIAISLPVRS